jgi:hypothetical protein
MQFAEKRSQGRCLENSGPLSFGGAARPATAPRPAEGGAALVVKKRELEKMEAMPILTPTLVEKRSLIPVRNGH